METNLKLERAESCELSIKYRNLIDTLLYISSSSKPDISYSETHWKYALRIFLNLYLTKKLNLCYNKKCKMRYYKLLC